MRVLFTITLFISSALLFLVQPMIAKMILPKFGGSPAVWNTSMVFFQGMLLLGYAYAHLSTKLLGVRKQAALHVCVLALAAILLPFEISSTYAPDPSRSPAGQLLWLLASKVGLVFFAISAGAPLLQRWFAETNDRQAKDPYFLYSASNLGSMLALLAYPLLVEPALRLAQQSLFWSVSFAALVFMMLTCAVALWKIMSRRPVAAVEQVQEEDAKPITGRDRLKYVLLAFAPSSLLLGVTTFVTSNLAPIPLLWVIPLALYLLTFIIAFSKWNVPTTKLGRALPLVVVPLALIMLMEATEPLPLLGGMHLVAFFVAALMCHGQLVKIRPGAKYLTEFYLWISVGGVLGGAFNALISPVLFNTLFEYPLAIVLACVLRPDGDSQAYKLVWQDFAYPAAVGLATVVLSFGAKAMSMPPSIARSAVTVAIPAVMCFLAIDRRVRFALALGALFLVGNELSIGAHGDVLEKARSFFGVHRVVQEDQYHQLLHGSTIHGQQSTAPLLRQEPMTYFHRTSPIGQLFRVFSGPKAKDRIAIVGLGVGALATYGEPGQSITYYEIDPEVARIATDPREFTFLRDSKAKVNIVMGDARLTIADAPPRSYGLIVLDAFSSDAIPVHLLTKDAVATYLQKLEPNGLLAFQISNRYVDMKGVLNDVAASLNLRCLFQDDESDGGKSPVPKAHSRWLLMAHRWEDFGFLAQSKRWEHLPALTNGRVWTDDYSNLAGALLK